MVAGDAVGPVPPSPPHTHATEWDPPMLMTPERSTLSQQRLRKNMHWGHIAFYYLVEQMHRWERFVFKFDKQFASIGALKAIEGMFHPSPTHFLCSQLPPCFQMRY